MENEEIKLSKNYTLKRVQELLDQYNESKNDLIDFIKDRFKSRFFEPLSCLKSNHFIQTAICCLLIETIYSFQKGKKNTSGMSTIAFKEFLGELYSDLNIPEANFENFFYQVRCGILHQSETTNEWRIKGDASSVGIDFKAKIVYANKLVQELEANFDKYIEDLKTKNELFELAKDKINHIVENSKNSLPRQ